MKKIAIGAASAVTALAFAGTAFAAPIVADHSAVIQVLRQRINNTIATEQTASIANSVNSSSNSGNNVVSAGNDIMKFGVTSGDADATSLVNNTANNAVIDTSSALDTTTAPMPAPGADVIDNSSIKNIDVQTESNTVMTGHSASASNSVTSAGNTGGNAAAAGNDVFKGGLHSGVSTSGTGVNNSFNNVMKTVRLYIVRR